MKKILVFYILLMLTLLVGCSKKAELSDNFFYYNDISKANFKLIQNGESIANTSNYMSIIRYKYEIKSRSYPIEKDYPLEIPFYLGEESDKIVGVRSNAPFTYESSIDRYASKLNIDYSNIDIDLETGNREFILEIISNDAVANKIDRSISISNMYKKDNKYQHYLDLDIDPSIKSLADEIRYSLPTENQDNLREISYAYVTWILENIYYPLDHQNYIEKYVNLNNSVKTLDLGVGVCEDYSVLLSEMLISQNIAARKLDGYYPKAREEEYASINDFILHQLVEVYDGEMWIILEPTIYNFQDVIDFEVDGKLIEVARGMKIDTIIVQPFIPEVVVAHGRAHSSRSTKTSGCELIDIDFVPLYK